MVSARLLFVTKHIYFLLITKQGFDKSDLLFRKVEISEGEGENWGEISDQYSACLQRFAPAIMHLNTLISPTIIE